MPKTQLKIADSHLLGNKKFQIRIRRDGMIEFLSPPPFKLVEEKSSKRYSEITPVNPFLYVLFRVCRFLFGEHGRVGNWTRKWDIEWRMTVLSTGYTETSRDRAALIDKEHELFFQPRGNWLN